MKNLKISARVAEAAMYTIDIDIGGTFTDGFFTNGKEVRTAKVITTPYDITECFMTCIREGSRAFEVELRQFLRTTSIARLSTTIGTNLLVQHNGPKIGLLVTRGDEETLYGSGRAHILDEYVPVNMVAGLEEEVDKDGRLVREVNREEVLNEVRRLVELGARMIVVSLRNAWRNAHNERRVRDYVLERYPIHYLRSVPMQLGTEVSHVPDDHVRTNSVAVNAYMHSEMARALYRAEDLLRAAGYERPLLVVHASGGNARVAKTVALHTLSSGPAVATRGASKVAQLLELKKVVTADMGGTSLDMAIVDDCQYELDLEPRVEEIPLGIPMIAVESIGAGGGSIAKLEDGKLRVGPESAGSVPGPVCYNKGGIEPTVTDANVLLGFIDPDYFLGGKMKLDVQRARRSIERRIARQSESTVEEAAYEIRERSNTEMATQLEKGLRQKGHAPEEFTLFSIGGAGPLHACSIADKVGIRRVVAFPYGSVFSAFGSSTTDVLHIYSKTLGQPMERLDGLEKDVLGYRDQAIKDMVGEGFEAADIDFNVEIVLSVNGERRMMQSSKVLEDVPKMVRENLSHEEAKNAALETLSIAAECKVPHWEPVALERTGSEVDRARKGSREVCWVKGTFAETPIYDRERLEHGHVIQGPAIVEGPDTNYPVSEGWELTVDHLGNFVMMRS